MCCMASLEMLPEEILAWMVMQMDIDTDNKKEIISSMNIIGTHLLMITRNNSGSPDEILSTMEFSSRKYNVKHFFIDSLMKMDFPLKDEYREQHKFVNALLNFAQKYYCHVHLIAHSRKTQNDSTPGAVDISGSSNIRNLASNIFMISRPSEKEKKEAIKNNDIIADNKLYVQKNKRWGIEGEVEFSFNVEKKQFREI